MNLIQNEIESIMTQNENNTSSAAVPVSSISRMTARLAILSTGLGVIAIIAMHVLRADLDPSWHVLSEYAISSHGWVMTTAFFAYAFACLNLFVALSPYTKSWIGRIGMVFLLLAAIGVGLAGAFQMDSLTTPMNEATTSAIMHNVGSIVGNPGFIVAALVLTRALRPNTLWSAVRLPMLVSANIAWISFLLLFASIAYVIATQQTSMDGIGLVGLANRLGMLAYAGFMVSAALPLTR